MGGFWVATSTHMPTLIVLDIWKQHICAAGLDWNHDLVSLRENQCGRRRGVRMWLWGV